MLGFLQWRFLLLGHPLFQTLAEILVMNYISSFLIVGLNSATQKGSTCLLCPVLPLLWLDNTAGQWSLMLTKADCLLSLPSCILTNGINRILSRLKENFLSLLEMHPTYPVFPQFTRLFRAKGPFPAFPRLLFNQHFSVQILSQCSGRSHKTWWGEGNRLWGQFWGSNPTLIHAICVTLGRQITFSERQWPVEHRCCQNT